MTRNITFVLCIVGLTLGGCYDHRTVNESDIAPITAEEDAGTEEPATNNGGDDDTNAGNNGAENNGGEDPTEDPGMGPFGDLDCENPPDRITELLCGLQEGGGMSGGQAGGFPGGTTGGRPGSTTGGMGGNTTGRPGGTTGGMGGTTAGSMPTSPEEIIQEIIDNLDCDAKDPDFITQLLCALTGAGGAGGGGGFPGFPPGGGGPGGTNR